MKNTSTYRSWSMMVMGLTTTISVGIWINLLTPLLQNPDISLTLAVKTLGWSNIWLTLALTISISQILIALWWKSKDREQRRKLKKSSIQLQNDLYLEMLKVTLSALSSFRPSITINARFFEHVIRNSKSVLKKNHQLHVEMEPLPDEIGLEEAFVGEDNLIMCDAFEHRVPIYEELEENHINRYGPRIRNLVDPRQRWVLACPVLPIGDPERDPIGVIVFFGTKPPVKNEQEKTRLKEVATILSKSFYMASTLEGILNEGILNEGI